MKKAIVWGEAGGRWRRLGIIMLVAMLVLGLWPGGPVAAEDPPRLTGINVQPGSLRLEPGETGYLRAFPVPEDAGVSMVEFESMDPDIARVVPDGDRGNVTGVSEGSTHIMVAITGIPLSWRTGGTWRLPIPVTVQWDGCPYLRLIDDYFVNHLPQDVGSTYPGRPLIGDYYGEVVVHTPIVDETTGELIDIDVWRPNPGDELLVGDVLQAKANSGFELSYVDMRSGSWEVKEGAVIGFAGAEQRQQRETSRMELLYGTILGNIKEMIMHGTLTVEMAHGVAGIKGTTLVMEETEDTSTVKVLEGEVEVRGKHRNEVFDLTEGQQVTMSQDSTTPVTGFSVPEEAGRWSEDVQRHLGLLDPDPEPDPDPDPQPQPDPGPEPDPHPQPGPGDIEVRLNVGRTDYTVNGETGHLDVPPFIRDGRIYVPVRFVGEAFGAEADWKPKDGPTEQVFLTKGNTIVGMKMGYTSIAILENGEERFVRGDAGPVIVNGRTFLPLRAAGEVFGAEFDWGPRGAATQWVTFTGQR